MQSVAKHESAQTWSATRRQFFHDKAFELETAAALVQAVASANMDHAQAAFKLALSARVQAAEAAEESEVKGAARGAELSALDVSLKEIAQLLDEIAQSTREQINDIGEILTVIGEVSAATEAADLKHDADKWTPVVC